MQTQEQKLRKEKFVSNNVGSTISEINLFLALASSRSKKKKVNDNIVIDLQKDNSVQHKSNKIKKNEKFFFSFISVWRSLLQLITIIAILAVDFEIFPRKFAKVETFGTSLMDLGVGCVVFSSGLVAGPRLKSRTAGIFSSIKTSSVLLLIGLLRALFTKSVNYQEHVSEYGIHWNFFFTLGSVSILVSFLQILFPQVKFSTLGYTVALVYEYLLHLGLENYILNAPRVNLISMNKEGIFSLF
ncbi:Glucosaminyl phosphatidylinositol (GlcN-PI) nositol acylation protein, partial [Lobulomyces angularis]